jgi:hypothetical protein
MYGPMWPTSPLSPLPRVVLGRVGHALAVRSACERTDSTISPGEPATGRAHDPRRANALASLASRAYRTHREKPWTLSRWTTLLKRRNRS